MLLLDRHLLALATVLVLFLLVLIVYVLSRYECIGTVQIDFPVFTIGEFLKVQHKNVQ